MKRALCLICMAMIFVGVTASSNPKIEVKVSVCSQDSLPLKNETIMIVDSSTTAFTDELGKATISCEIDSELVVYAQAYKSIMVKVESSTVNVVLEKDVKKSKSKKTSKK